MYLCFTARRNTGLHFGNRQMEIGSILKILKLCLSWLPSFTVPWSQRGRMKSVSLAQRKVLRKKFLVFSPWKYPCFPMSYRRGGWTNRDTQHPFRTKNGKTVLRKVTSSSVLCTYSQEKQNSVYSSHWWERNHLLTFAVTDFKRSCMFFGTEHGWNSCASVSLRKPVVLWHALNVKGNVLMLRVMLMLSF